MRASKSSSFALLLAVLPGCLAPQSSGAGKTTAEAETSHAVINDTPRPADPPTVTEANAFATASNAFGDDLYARLSKQSGNFAMSPASISMALAMTWAGAHGDTQAEMTQVLHLEGDPKAMTASAGKLLSTFNASHADYTLHVVNRLFGDKGYPFDAGFLALTKNDFGAELTPVDFQHASEPARNDINAYVAKQTNDKIQDLLAPGTLDDTARLVLVNAVYLNAKWQSPFFTNGTKTDAFHTSPDATSNVPTMHGDLNLAYADTDGVSVIDMPYQGGDLTMTVLLPDDASGLGALEQKIEHGGIDAFVAKEKEQTVRVALPKFTVETNGALSLKDALEDMGMKKAFIDGSADFSSMIASASRNDASQKLHLSNAYHKAFVAVNEAGTEAAGATAVIATVRGMEATPKAQFNADHPFLFAIRDKKSGLVLFMGRVVNPV